MLVLNNIYAGYTEKNMILKGVDLTIEDGQVVALVGQNGSGKSTLAKTILNLVPHHSGDVLFNQGKINQLPAHKIADRGIGYFMQGGRVFPHLTVSENLMFAGRSLKKQLYAERVQALKDYFEFLSNGRMNLLASFLSGGEQHQLALAMVLLPKPAFLLLDEPSAGLSPVNVQNLYNILSQIKSQVNSILIIEQNVNAAIAFSDRIALLQQGKIARIEASKKLDTAKKIDDFFFGSLHNKEM